MNYYSRLFHRLNRNQRLNWLPDRVYLKMLYYANTGKRLSIKNPQTFNEKLQWLKLYDRKPLYTTLVDKYEVKNYVASIIGEDHIIPTYGVWDRFEDIEFEKLPSQFVLKCTHNSGGVLICKDRNKFDKENAKQRIEKCMRKNYFWSSREWPYKNVKPRIIVEKYMEDRGFADKEPNEYQFWCFNGIPRFISAIFQPHGDNMKATYDIEWNRLAFVTSYPEYQSEVDIPSGFEEMKNIAIQLSKNQIFARIDFLVFNSNFYFGEITKFPASGFVRWQPTETDKELGYMLNISK